MTLAGFSIQNQGLGEDISCHFLCRHTLIRAFPHSAGITTTLSSGVISGGQLFVMVPYIIYADRSTQHDCGNFRSGLMGLAWPSLVQTRANPFWLALTSSGALESPLFAFSLARFSGVSSASTTETNGGSMDIGFTDTDRFSGSINYISLAQENYWLIPLQAITINGNKLNPGGNAAIDT